MNNSRKYIILIACLLAIGLSSVAQQVRPVYPVKPLTQEDISRRQRIPEWGTNTRSASSAVLPEGVDNSTLKISLLYFLSWVIPAHKPLVCAMFILMS